VSFRVQQEPQTGGGHVHSMASGTSTSACLNSAGYMNDTCASKMNMADWTASRC